MTKIGIFISTHICYLFTGKQPQRTLHYKLLLSTIVAEDIQLIPRQFRH